MDFFSDWENSPLFAWPVGIGWPAWSAWAVYGGSLFVVLTVLIVCISCCCCCCGGSTRRCCLPCRCSSCCQPNEYIANYAPPALENSGFKRGVSGRRLSGIDPDTPAAGTAGGSSSSGGGASTAHLNSSGGRKATASGEFAAPDNILQLIGGSAAVTPSINPIDEEPPALTRDNSLHGGGGGGYLEGIAADDDEDPSSPTSPNPTKFKSWQTYTNAVEGRVAAPKAPGSTVLKSALKKGDQLRRKDSVSKIAKYRKDKEGVKGSLVMNAAYDGPQTDANAVIASVDGGDLAHANPLSPQNAKFAANPVSMIEEYTATPTKKLQPISLTEKQQFAAKKDINSLKMEMEVHPDSRGNTSLLPDGTRYPEFEKPVNMGRRVNVKGYECEGVLRFFGPHKTKPGFRCGVEMDLPVGKNNGKVNGHQYFICRKKHGVLCLPHKVQFVVYSDDDDDDDDDDGGGYLEVLDEEGEAERVRALGGPAADEAEVARRNGGGGGGGSTVRPRSQYSLSPDKMSAESRAEAAVPSSCVATHAFVPNNEDELGLEVGVRVQVLQQPDGGWWEGKVQGVGIKPGRQGWFPSNHVELEAVAVRPRSLYSLNPGKGLASPARESAGSSSTVTTCKVIHKYVATNADELSFAVGDTIDVMDDPDGGWWHGKVLPSGEPGWFPSNHVTGQGGAASSPTTSVRASNAAILERARLQGWETYTATHDFEPRNEDECELVEGDTVSVVQKPDGGWWEVIVDGVHGWVPRSHLGDTAAAGDTEA